MTELFEVISVNAKDCINAFSLPIDDFEDALVVICAIKAGIDYIVTRDELFPQAPSSIKIVAPGALIGLL